MVNERSFTSILSVQRNIFPPRAHSGFEYDIVFILNKILYIVHWDILI